jgi:lipopolysaccharide export system permease protein
VKLLDRYLARRMAAAVLKTMVALVLIVIAIDLITHRSDNIIRFAVPWPVVAHYYVAMIPQFLGQYQIAALAVLVGGLMVLGAAAQDNETVAALAGGVSLRRLMAAPALVALAVSVAMLLLAETVGPAANRQAYALESQYLTRAGTASRAGVSWAHLSGDWTCHIRKFNRLALSGEDVLMDRIREDELIRIEAARIYWSPAQQQWLLENGQWETHRRDTHGKRIERITQRAAPITETPEELFAIEDPPETRSGREFAQVLRAAEMRNMPVGPQWVYYHAKYAQSTLPFVMIWLAAPFALRLRRGGIAVGFGVSIAIALVYVIVFWLFMGLGIVGKLPPALAAWAASGIFLICALIGFKLTPT